MLAKSVSLFILLLSCIYLSYSQKCSEVKTDHRIDCTPDHHNDKEVCNQRKCCFVEHNSTNAKIPNCFLPNDYIGYKVKETRKDTKHIFVTLERQTPSGFPHDIKDVSIAITFLNDKSLRIKITDPQNARFEPPVPQINLPEFPVTFNPLYDIEVDSKGVLTIVRKSTKKVVFSTELEKLIFSDQFMQIKSSLPSERIYGLGEHKAGFLKNTNWQIYTMFNHDHPGRPPADMNLYGSHPFYLNVEDNEGNSNGVFLFNSNAMDVLLQPQPAITWRPIGGILDIFVFLGPKPDDVVREYIHLIGTPAMPPFWSLGYHQCRCCPEPKTLSDQMKITDRTIKAGIPFDVQWNAKEYMHNVNDFTIGETFKGFGDFVSHLHDIGMHYVPIVDPGIDPTQPAGTYPPFDEGKKMDIFVKNASGKMLIGKVWNRSGKTVYPDFSHPNASLYWTNQYKSFHKMVAIDGSWNDMNEVANFVTGSLDGCPANNPYDHPPYVPGNRPLADKTICMSAKHHAGLHYNVHNLYALYMAMATNVALREVRQKRPFIVSRASSPGLGKYAGHWDGDVDTSYVEMAWTIPSVMNFNMFGIPLVGGDICGFTGKGSNNSDFHELCSRWLEIGAFYPFSRNHNTKGVDQDPVALGSGVVKAAKNALEKRYSLLPYLYTLFYLAEANGDTVARPLFFEFPNDSHSYGEVSESQFMWGKAFMIIPAIKEKQTKVNAYFPSGQWYSYELELNSKPLKSTGQSIELEAPLDKINTYVRGGHIIPSLPPKQTTTQLRKEKFTLIVALDEKDTGSGQLYWDDGDSIDTIKTEKYSLISFETKEGKLTTEPIHHKYEGDVLLDKVVVLGLKTKPNSVSVNGHSHDFTYESNMEKMTISGIAVNLVDAKHEIIWK